MAAKKLSLAQITDYIADSVANRAANREAWAVETDYVYPGAIQYFGSSEVCDTTTVTLALEKA